MDDLIDWRWDSLAKVLRVWVPLYSVFKKYWSPAVFGGESSSVTVQGVTNALADERRVDMAVWTHQFSYAHFFEGCYCHEEELTDPESREKVRCCWKGRRLPWLAVGNLQTALREAMSNNEICVLGHLLSRPSDIASRFAPHGGPVQQSFCCRGAAEACVRAGDAVGFLCHVCRLYGRAVAQRESCSPAAS